MYCFACGAQNTDDSRFCGSCGGSLTVASMPTQYPGPAGSPSPSITAESGRPEYLPSSSAPHPPELSMNQAPPVRSGMSPGLRVFLGIVGAVVAWLIIQFAVIPALSGGVPFGQFKLTTSVVESNIESKYAEEGIAATATCPGNMVGKPGDEFFCTVDLPLFTKKATVTIASDGGFTWIVQAGFK